MNIASWHIVIGGFLQRQSNLGSNGTIDLWHKIHEIAARQDIVVEWHSWNANFDQLAERIYRLRNGCPSVYIYCYSWGATGAILLATALSRRGLYVQVIVSSDGVYRHWYWLGQWRAMWPYSFLQLPENVHRVYRFVQSNPRFSLKRKCRKVGYFAEPAGHNLVRSKGNCSTIMHSPVMLPYDHNHMDNATEFHKMSCDIARDASRWAK